MGGIMKKYYYLILVLAVLFCASTVMGQIQLGVVAGVNMANISVTDGPEDLSFKTRMGFAAGAVACIGINEMIAIQVEPTYMQKGAKVEEDGEELGTEKLDYVDIPILAKVSFGQANAKPYILAGPALGILLSAKEESTDGESVDVKDNYKSIDFGINFGAGVGLLMGKNTLFLEGQYGLGLANILDVSDTKIKNKGIQIKAGITFPIGG
jgi:hypothetical protein